MKTLLRKLRGTPPEPASNRKKINLGLQGGGAHGAFTWGVLDYLLEDGRLDIEGISGASAGAMNAVILADGLARGGPEEARKRLAEFWRAASLDGKLPGLQRAVLDRLLSFTPFQGSPADAWFGALVALSLALRHQPAQHQSAARPDRALRRLRGGARMQGRVSSSSPPPTCTPAALRIFPQETLNADIVMASACLPSLFRAVEIDGVPYWDGGYMGNPAIFPFFGATQTEDVLIVQINPIERDVDAAHPVRDHEPHQRDHVQFLAAGRIPRDRFRHPADRPGAPAARHRRGRIPPHQRAPHSRSTRPSRT